MIFLDMDGVICNLVQGAIEAHKRPELHDRITNYDLWQDFGISESEFWRKCSGVDFWFNLDEYPWAVALVETAESLAEHYFLTTPTTTKKGECIDGKELWLGGDAFRMIPTEHKQLLAAPGRVLIDDNTKNIEQWIKHGGIGIGLKQPWNNFSLDGWQVIEKLKEFF